MYYRMVKYWGKQGAEFYLFILKGKQLCLFNLYWLERLDDGNGAALCGQCTEMHHGIQGKTVIVHVYPAPVIRLSWNHPSPLICLIVIK